MSKDSSSAADRGSELNDQLGLAVNCALFDPACQRLNEWALIGPVQRAALESFAERLLAAERERCAREVPNNWCDPLLTGPQSLVRATDDCQMVERLLRAIAARIRGA